LKFADAHLKFGYGHLKFADAHLKFGYSYLIVVLPVHYFGEQVCVIKKPRRMFAGLLFTFSFWVL
jgi:hypothetical protein